MNTTAFESFPFDQLSSRTSQSEPDWLWSGFLARGDITLLTSGWKLGKTTLLAGVLRRSVLGTRSWGKPAPRPASCFFPRNLSRSGPSGSERYR